VLAAEQGEQLLQGLVFCLDAILDVGPVEARHKVPGGAEVEALGDLVVSDLGGSRREGDARHGGPAVVQHRQLQVVGAEVVAPLRYTVRLIDREQGDGSTIEQLCRGFDAQSFRSEIKKVEFTGDIRRLHTPALRGILR
jgi:hypothetical protein